MTLLQQRDLRRVRDRERARTATRDRLRQVVRRLLPDQRVWVFGSLCREGGFGMTSDVDIAIEELPEGKSLYMLHSEFEELLGRPIDVVLLPESRLREKILRDGELWMP